MLATPWIRDVGEVGLELVQGRIGVCVGSCKEVVSGQWRMGRREEDE
jgi:hypothetical protein